MTAIDRLFLAQALTEKVDKACKGLAAGKAPILEQVTPATRDLLMHWFSESEVDLRNAYTGFNFHRGQRQAILNCIYAHEIIQPQRLTDLYQEIAPETLASPSDNKRIMHARNQWPKYCVKMATGTGKTWVLQALLIWQFLNADATPEDPRFTKNFILITPGNIIYDRLLNALAGPELDDGKRDFNKADIKKFSNLFLPLDKREKIDRFFQNAVCKKEDIGDKTTGGGLIAVANWQSLSADRPEEEDGDDDDAPVSSQQAVKHALPLTPSKAAGHALDVLDSRAARGKRLEWLAALPSLMVFNDEAHHIHETKIDGEEGTVVWQRLLEAIAGEKSHRFMQVDFSATPYLARSGKKGNAYFEHIICDFDLKTAMREGLVKNLVLDERSEFAALSEEDIDFRAKRDARGNPIELSEGQILMLKMGLKSLEKRATAFYKLDYGLKRTPKLFVLCEDTKTAPLVEQFLKDEAGLADEEILTIHTKQKGEVSEEEWKKIKRRVHALDDDPKMKAIISVLMLREGFDVSNICVIVPLRSAKAPILLEQTIGRGLRLMWREKQFEEMRRDNLISLREGQKPKSLIDVLSIIEHPAFREYYEELKQEGLVGSNEEDDPASKKPLGDIIKAGLRDGYEAFDFAIPSILRDSEENISWADPDFVSLASYRGFTLEQLKKQAGKGDKATHRDTQTGTIFEGYQIEGHRMTASGYHDYLARLARRIAEPPRTFPIFPLAGRAHLVRWIDFYIKSHLFEQVFKPLEDENWRVLLLDHIVDHISQIFSERLFKILEEKNISEPEIQFRHLSEVQEITMRENYSLPVNKCIYPRLGYPAQGGGFERAFIEAANRDGSIDAFCKIYQQKHDFLHFQYLKENGRPGMYIPDFLARCESTVYLVETKAQRDMNQADVKRKKRAALAWCDHINALPSETRHDLEWRYALVGEHLFYNRIQQASQLDSILGFSSLKQNKPTGQQSMDFEI